jgi:anion-transporting  ArsA/GET3 family ATPase
MPALLDHSFLFVAGKGGVGKTTVAAAIAWAATRNGKRVLVAMANAKERLSYLLEVAPIGPHNQTVAEHLDAVNIVPQHALEEYGLMVLKSRTLQRAIFKNKLVTGLLRGTPGIEAWSMLGKAFFHAKELQPDGRKRYDLVIFDAPATGHGLDMLRVPKVLVEVAPPGLLRREAEEAIELFRDPSRTGVVLVTLLEEMPVNETIELHAALRDELRMPVHTLVVNRVLPQLFPVAERSVVVRLAEQIADRSPLYPLALAGRQRAIREQVQEQSLTKLASALPEVPRVMLPMLFTATFRRDAIESLSQAFYR